VVFDSEPHAGEQAKPPAVSIHVTPFGGLLRSFCTLALKVAPPVFAKTDVILVTVTEMGGAAAIVKVSESDLVESEIEIALSVRLLSGAAGTEPGGL
jgi:hypothetical protein